MYVLPEIEGALRTWWQGLARHLRQAGVDRVPNQLDEPDDLPVQWLDGDLLFSQTCGYPLTHALDQRVSLIAAPTYDAPGCHGFQYRSMIVVRDDLPVASLGDLRQCDVAINNWDSQSGFNGLRARIAGLATPGERFFAHTLITTGHARSIAAVCSGEVQCAAIDGVTLALFQRHRPEAVSRLHILDQTDRAPGLPYITRKEIGSDDLNALRTGLFAALADPELADARADLLLSGAALVEWEAYDVIRHMEAKGKEVPF
jgi:ABC-type phosphate/phosphonate transport system substrate-binding protein